MRNPRAWHLPRTAGSHTRSPTLSATTPAGPAGVGVDSSPPPIIAFDRRRDRCGADRISRWCCSKRHAGRHTGRSVGGSNKSGERVRGRLQGGQQAGWVASLLVCCCVSHLGSEAVHCIQPSLQPSLSESMTYRRRSTTAPKESTTPDATKTNPSCGDNEAKHAAHARSYGGLAL